MDPRSNSNDRDDNENDNVDNLSSLEEAPTIPTTTRPPNRKMVYRGGFTTSICDFFSTNPSRKSDCCSFVCLGLLQSDKNEYSLLASSSSRRPRAGEESSSTQRWIQRQQNQRRKWLKRILINIGIPILYLLVMRILSRFFVTSHTSYNNTDDLATHEKHTSTNSSSNDIGTQQEQEEATWILITFVGLFILILILLVRGEYHRVNIRRAIMKRIYQKQYRDTNTNAPSAAARDDEHTGLLTTTSPSSAGVAHATFDSYFRMHEKDVWSAHWTIAYHHRDCIELTTHDTDDNDDGEDPSSSSDSDCCTYLWKLLSCLCCGWCCNWWLVCCGMCAIGQEDRQLQELIPAKVLLVDYVTFQRYNDYFWNIVQVRLYHKSKFIEHIMAISHLTKDLLRTLGLGLVIMAIAVSVQYIPTFQVENLLVVLATFFQAFFLLYFIHWLWDRFNLSLDAVVKYFASGFLLCTGLALAYELIISQFFTSISELVMMVTIYKDDHPNTVDEENSLRSHFQQDHPIIAGIFLFFQSFVIAATVEEMCKYFSFWMVEHPDFVPPNELLLDDDNNDNSNDSTAAAAANANSGYDRVSPIASNQYGSVDIGESTAEQTNDTNPSQRQREVLCQYEQQRRTHVVSGRGITVAMVSTALGFACCENLVYVFLYTEPQISNQIATLIARSLFPVHPLAAAIQSIGVCRRDLEGDKSMGLGKILAPAIILHGWFDFVLMSLKENSDANEPDTTTNRSDDYNPFGENNDERFDNSQKTDEFNAQAEAMFAVINSCVTVVLGIAYYFWFASKQRSRLAELDQQSVLNTS